IKSAGSAATTLADAETGAKTRVNGLFTKLVKTKIAKIAERTFLKERRRGFLRVRFIRSFSM
ncbi:MAG: hypothetical protein M3444_23625, partial [Acidobacteriota bacterium]|nr:hypothetical protein [Acidobacteriota bacterium]